MFFYIFKPEKTFKKCKITNNKNIFFLHYFLNFFVKIFILFVKIFILFVKIFILFVNLHFLFVIPRNIY